LKNLGPITMLCCT